MGAIEKGTIFSYQMQTQLKNLNAILARFRGKTKYRIPGGILAVRKPIIIDIILIIAPNNEGCIVTSIDKRKYFYFMGPANRRSYHKDTYLSEGCLELFLIFE